MKIDEFTYTSSLLQNLGSGELIVKKYQQQQQLQQQSAMLMWNTSGLGKSCGEFGLHGVEEELIVEEEEVMASGKSTGSMSQQPAHQYQKPYDSKLKKILKEKR